MPQNVYNNIGNVNADSLHIVTKDDSDTNLEVYSMTQTNTVINNATDKCKSISISYTLSANNWSSSKTQDILSDYITETNNGIVTFASNMTSDQLVAGSKAQIRLYGQHNGSIVVICDGDIPTIDLPLSLIVFP